MKKICLASLFTLIAGVVVSEVTITNLIVAQRPGTKLVDITYDVFNSEYDAVVVSLNVKNGSSTVVAAHVTGDLGKGVPTGTERNIVWDGGADWNGNVANLLYTLTADDGMGVCPVSKTGQTAMWRTGDDGDFETGVAWNDPRFTDYDDGTVKDTLTGLEWVKAPHSLAGNAIYTDWNSAIDFCKNLVYAGHTDWRLPSRKELMSLVDYGLHSPALPSNNPFNGLITVSYPYYWTGTTVASDTQRAYNVDISAGDVGIMIKGVSYYVLPVRNGSEGVCPVPKTGQTTSYRSGDDGSLRPGTSWPNPRFINTGSGTVVDALTGLEWVQSPHSLTENSNSTNWTHAIDFCESLSYAGHTDWRLPNIRELESLVHCGMGTWGNDPYEWLNSSETPFSGIDPNLYWSSTTLASDTNKARTVWMVYGHVATHPKTDAKSIWPVRSSWINGE